MTHVKNSTTQHTAQYLLTTTPINFSEEFMGKDSITTHDAISESSSLLASALAIITQLSERGPIDESAACGILLIVQAAKALTDSTYVSVSRAAQQGGAQ